MASSHCTNGEQESDYAHHDACGVGLLFSPVTRHSVIADSLTALAALEHRGACGADEITGDGAGILAAIPWALFSSEGLDRSSVSAVGTVFLPTEPRAYEVCRTETERFFQDEQISCVGWRAIPHDPAVLGPDARASCPRLEHLFISAPGSWDERKLEQRLMVVRKRLINHLWANPDYSDFYIASLSSTTIVYKAMTSGTALKDFYSDLRNELFTSKFAIIHRRFSTNTMPRWRLAQPFRLLGHNGEINTLAGNRKAVLARTRLFESVAFMNQSGAGWPVVHRTGSDSANLDNLMEFLVCAGLSTEEALMRLIPEASGENGELSEPSVASFYEYHAANQEPWDGPALIVYSDGRTAGALLDKNGLRPARYTILKDGTLFLCSEAGAFPLPLDMVANNGRLGPGEIISVDLNSGAISFNDEVRRACATLHQYDSWLQEERVQLNPQPFNDTPQLSLQSLTQQAVAVGIGAEEIGVIRSMAEDSKEPLFSMGDDAALAILSKKPRSLFDYFKQRFAQVTNPPIDHLRERIVMSLCTYLGAKSQSVLPSRAGARLIKCLTPILNDAELDSLSQHSPNFSIQTISLLTAKTGFNLQIALNRLCAEVTEAVRKGQNIIVLSDRFIDSDSVAIPVLAAVGAVHNHLIHERLRTCCSIVADTAQCWSPHHFACLFGYGAEAVSPYLMWELIKQPSLGSSTPANDVVTTQRSFRIAIEDALLKTLAKMGITTLSSYIGGQLFENIGLSHEVVGLCFQGTPTHLPGLGFAGLQSETLLFHSLGFDSNPPSLPDHGLLKNRVNGEFHGNNPDTVKTLHAALGLKDQSIDVNQRQETFRAYSALIRNRPPSAVRDLLTHVSDRKPIALDQVESAERIVKRFCTGGMSLGALSREVHEVLAIAMNRLGGKSNSGEGGEDPARYRSNINASGENASVSPLVRGLRNGDNSASAIRQIASARFGVTTDYVASARQLEIKIAQGAKPGEGGQLPARKVSEYIGKLRRAKHGMTLISPPPHHDIYSIEDLAQLIFDLRQVNPRASISVKLVASAGIGTIAAGVAKANADVIQVSGHDGGTGAAAVSSIKNAGIPWEFGLSEVHQVLLASKLRDRVLLRVDGGIRTGWDVVTAALLGAQEYGFGTIALIAAGCIMARVCHTNNCPVGITSQKQALREKFTATPEQIEHFFLHIAEEVRHILAELGYSSLDEIVGRTDLLGARTDVTLNKCSELDFSNLLKHTPGWRPGANHVHTNGLVLDDLILVEPEVKQALEHHESVSKSYPISNTDRSVGARIAGWIAHRHGDGEFRGQVRLDFTGTAGQSFGAFNVTGLSLSLLGAANDFVGKGMNGGQIVVRAARNANASEAKPHLDQALQEPLNANVTVGNACLYGATGGALFVDGCAGERFAVRNSGASAVIEGAGDHCCEYMTGGTVVVLGKVGRNFGAGMTGGVAYLLECGTNLAAHINLDMGKQMRRAAGTDTTELRRLIDEHYQLTGSSASKTVLDNWEVAILKFWQLFVFAPATSTSNDALQAPVVLPAVR